MAEQPLVRRSLTEALRELKDPRRKQRRAHELVPVLLMAVAAMLCGCRSLYAIAQWGRERREDDPALLAQLGLAEGKSPSVATLHRLFKRLDVGVFERILGTWLRETAAPSKERELLAVDGKALRGIHGEEVPGMHLVAVYAVHSQAVIAQLGAGGKGKELPAVKAVLEEAPVAGAVVAGDALQTQRAICEGIAAKGGTTSSV